MACSISFNGCDGFSKLQAIITLLKHMKESAKFIFSFYELYCLIFYNQSSLSEFYIVNIPEFDEVVGVGLVGEIEFGLGMVDSLICKEIPDDGKSPIP